MNIKTTLGTIGLISRLRGHNMSNYRYTPASLAGRAKKGTQPKQSYIDLFQETLNEQFYNASN